MVTTTGAVHSSKNLAPAGRSRVRLFPGCWPAQSWPIHETVLTFPSHAPFHQAARVCWLATAQGRAGLRWTSMSGIRVHLGLFSSWALQGAWPRSSARGVVQTRSLIPTTLLVSAAAAMSSGHEIPVLNSSLRHGICMSLASALSRIGPARNPGSCVPSLPCLNLAF